MRYSFGGGIADWAFSTVTVSGTADLAQLTGSAVVTFWTTETGGSQYTDLLDGDGQPISTVTAADGAGTRAKGQIPPFKGPDGVTKMWAQAGTGPRALMITTDAADATPEVGMILPPLSAAGPVASPRQGKGVLYNDTTSTLRLDAVRASVGTAPTTAYVFDVNRNGVSVYSNPADRPSILVGATTSGRVTPTEMVVIAPGDYLTVDVDAGAGAEDLTVQIAVSRAS